MTRLTPFEKLAVVFAALVTVMSLLVAARFEVMERRIRELEDRPIANYPMVLP